MSSINGQDIRKIVVASNGGTGSSVMLSRDLSRQLRQYPAQIQNAQASDVPEDADVVVCHVGEAAGARGGAAGTVIVSFQLFHGDPAISKLISVVKHGGVLNAPLLNRPQAHHLRGGQPSPHAGDRIAADRIRTTERSQTAAAIEAAHPGWSVIYGAGSAKLFAFPMWQYAGEAVTVSASSPAELVEAISRIENELRHRAHPRPMAPGRTDG